MSLAVAAYGVAFGATARASGASVAQACSLSLLMFTGASQSALVSVLGTGGTVAATLSVAWLLGARNGLYAVRVSSLLPTVRWKRAVGAHFVIDETMAMAVVHDTPEMGRYAFWATALTLFFFWNLSTLLGALAGGLMKDPGTYGLDVAFPAAFLALVWPQLKGRPARRTALAAIAIAITSVPFAPKGVPVLLCVVATLVGVGGGAGVDKPSEPGGATLGAPGGQETRQPT